MAFDFSKLNKQQEQAVYQTEGPVIVTAGAGTGKTRLLTHRIAYLIEKKGVLPENILAITFTNKATNEMRERILNNVEGGDRVTISTFHSLCVKILRSDISRLDQAYNRFFTIYDDADQEKVLKNIFKAESESDDEIKDVVSYYISKAKNDGITPADFERSFPLLARADEIASYYEKYEAELKKNNALDFDDLIIKTIMLFKKCPDVLSKYQNKFRYIHIDEFQDTNAVQYDLASMLADAHKNILVVGDEDQSIYGWRGANYKNLFRFCEDFKGAKLFKLEENYRSSKAIIEKANLLIANNNERFDKVLYTNNNDGSEVAFECFDSDLEEADFVARSIKRQIDGGASLNDFAVLFRVNSVSRLFENAFVKFGVPYKVFGGLKFFDRAEIKNILAYLKLAVNPNDNSAFERVINFPKRGVGKVTVDSILGNARLQGVSALEFVLGAEKEFKNKGIEEFKKIMQNLISETNSLGMVDVCTNLIANLKLNIAYGSGSEEDLARLMNIKSFISAVNDFAEDNENATIVDFLENVALSSADENDENGVVLATVHAVKGLEFKNVFVVACEENMFPFVKSIDEGNIEEERRLMYVAITRARENLMLTCAKRRFSFGGGFDSFSLKSRFIGELGLASKTKEWGGAKQTSTRPMNNNFGGGNNKQNFASPQEFLKSIGAVHRASDLFQKNKNISAFRPGVRVSHIRFGEGVIKEVNGTSAKIIFENGSEKELNLDFAPLEILED